jgi:subtilisin family serine protease
MGCSYGEVCDAGYGGTGGVMAKEGLHHVAMILEPGIVPGVPHGWVGDSRDAAGVANGSAPVAPNEVVIVRTAAVLLVIGVVLLLGGGVSQSEAREGRGPQLVPGRYIVVLQPGADAAGVAKAHSARPDIAYNHAINGFAGVLTLAQVGALRADSRVVSIEQDQVVSIAEQTVPTGVQRIFAPGNTKIGINGVDDSRVDVDVAVIDTGIDSSHPDLNVVTHVNCSGGSPFKQSCSSGGTDDNGHGSHVAGTIGAIDNGIGVVGVAPGARLWGVKVLSSSGSGYMSWIVAGVDYVAANSAQIEVANMSLGCECTSAALNTAISNAVAKGVVFVVAAGNSAKDASTFLPANHPDVITVSALADFDGLPGGNAPATCLTDVDDTLAYFSNFGSAVNITAPGTCILSTIPGGGYAAYSGTSMAAPHVAGAAAILASQGAPTNKSGVQALAGVLYTNGNDNWTDDSGDGIKEPLLDVSNQSAFAPKLVAGSGGGTPPPETDDPPIVSITSPSAGSTVSGSVTIAASASDDNGVTQVEFFVNGTLIGIDSDGSNGWSVIWDTTSAANGSYDLTARATDTAGQKTTSNAINVTASNDTGGGGGGNETVLSASLAGTTSNAGSSWVATVTITVVDGAGNKESGAKVSGRWNGGEIVTCTTSGNGTCSPPSLSSPKRVGSVTFEVTDVSLSGHEYDEGYPSITLIKP